MERRSFLKLAAMSGLSLALPKHAKAAVPPHNGPFYVMLQAGGGWDPVYLCDPKPKDPTKFNRLYDYDPANPSKVGNIHYADIPLVGASLFSADQVAKGAMNYVMSNAEFFAKWHTNTLVVNGLNMETNNHDRGVVTVWSGRAEGAYPNFGALVAATLGPQQPLSFLSSGGYNGTGNLVPVTRLNNAGLFRRLAEPNMQNPSDPANMSTWLNPDTFDRITKAQTERLQALQSDQHLPRIATSAGQLYSARATVDALAAVQLPDALITDPTGAHGDTIGLCQQAQLAVAAFAAGVAVSANLQIGGFDTHGNHDTQQVRQLAKLLWAIDFLMTEAQTAGILDKLVIMVGSDFGRGNGYNGVDAASGKDHWPTGSVMFLSGDPSVVGGDRVVGATTVDKQTPIGIDPITLELDEGETGVVITAAHVHDSLRKLANVIDKPGAEKFKVFVPEDEQLMLFP